MKTFRSLLVALFAVGLIACSSNPTDSGDEFEEYIVGTFKIVTPTKAEYIGEKSSKKTMSAQGDTIDIKQPGQRSLTLYQNDNHKPNQFNIEFTDSTVNHNDYQNENLQQPEFEFPSSDINTQPISSSGYRMDYSPDYIKATINMETNCNLSSLENASKIILVKYKREDDSIFRVYRIHVDGIVDAIRDIVCT